MQPIRIGNFEIGRIADYQGPFFDPAEFFPDFDPAVVEEHADLLGPRLLEPGTGKLIFSFHSFLVRTGRHTILIDSCIGNDKERPTRPQFHHYRSSFIDDLGRLGVKPGEIDLIQQRMKNKTDFVPTGSLPYTTYKYTVIVKNITTGVTQPPYDPDIDVPPS